MKMKLNNNELFIGKVFSYLHATGWNEIVLSITFWVGESGGVVESTRIFRVRDAYVFVIGNLNKECCDTPLPRLFLLDDVTHLFFSIYLFHSILFFLFFFYSYISYLMSFAYFICWIKKLLFNLKDFHFIKDLFHTPMLFYQLLFLFIYLFCFSNLCMQNKITYNIASMTNVKLFLPFFVST